MCHTPAQLRPSSVTHVSHTRPTSPVERYTFVTHPSHFARRALHMCHTPGLLCAPLARKTHRPSPFVLPEIIRQPLERNLKET